MGCDVGHRLGSDPALLWLWCGPAAIALIQPLALEPPYAVGAALKKKKKKKKKEEEEDWHFQLQTLLPTPTPSSWEGRWTRD